MSVSTPCIRVCVIDRARGLCEGCGRTLSEISAWGGMSEAERRAIMATLPQRLSEIPSAAVSPRSATR